METTLIIHEKGCVIFKKEKKFLLKIAVTLLFLRPFGFKTPKPKQIVKSENMEHFVCPSFLFGTKTGSPTTSNSIVFRRVSSGTCREIAVLF